MAGGRRCRCARTGSRRFPPRRRGLLGRRSPTDAWRCAPAMGWVRCSPMSSSLSCSRQGVVQRGHRPGWCWCWCWCWCSSRASPIGRPPTRASTAGLEAARWALTCLTLALTPRCSPSLRARLLADGQTERLLGLLLGSAAGARRVGQERAPAHRRDPCPHGGPRSSPAASRSSRRSGPRRVALAVVAPAWLGGLIPRQWARRYGQRGDDWRLPTSEHARIERAVEVGRDGLLLVEAVYGPDAPAELAGVEAVQVLGATWIQQFYRDGSQVRWRDKQTGLPPASC